MEDKHKKLIEYCQGIYKKENGKELYDKYIGYIEKITPQDLVFIENEQLKMGMSASEMLTYVDKLINVFYKYLSKYPWERPKDGEFLYYLIKENNELVKRLEKFKPVIKDNASLNFKDKLSEFIEEIQLYNEHILKLENILFPYMEKKKEQFNGFKIMWALHDKIRFQIKELKRILKEPSYDKKEAIKILGKLYFGLYGLVQKQELILFPAATEVLNETDLKQMHIQSFDYEFSYIDKPKYPIQGYEKQEDANKGIFLATSTGNLTIEQIKAILDIVPLDMTLVDENDKVAYFSKPVDRLFPRSPAVIGRNVRNCHPPDSVHMVEDILLSFKSGKEEKAEFWIKLKGMFIYIQYFALRDKNGRYIGTLELSQEVSKIRELKGERRLLEWR